MQKYRVYFATKDFAPTRWFRPKKDVSETEYVVVSAFNEAHASKEAKKHVDIEALSVPFRVTRIEHAAQEEEEGCHGSFAKTLNRPTPPEADAAGAESFALGTDAASSPEADDRESQ